MSLKADFVVDWRDGFWVATNFTSSPQAIPAKPGVQPLIGGRTVLPGSVAVWVD
jgi:beta-galactosidase